MQRKDLASALNISPSMVSRLAQRGMPTDDVERARRWRKRHLDPGRIKGARFSADPAPVCPVAVDDDDLALDMVVAFECLALAAHHWGGGSYVEALAHLFPVMSLEQQRRALESEEVHPDLWGPIDSAIERSFRRHLDGGAL